MIALLNDNSGNLNIEYYLHQNTVELHKCASKLTLAIFRASVSKYKLTKYCYTGITFMNLLIQSKLIVFYYIHVAIFFAILLVSTNMRGDH